MGAKISLFLSLVKQKDIGALSLLGDSLLAGPTSTTTTTTMTRLASRPFGNSEFSLLSFKTSVGNGLNPTTKHFSNILKNHLNFQVISLINNASIFCQSNQNFQQVKFMALA